MEHKTFAVSEIKADGAKGEFEALVSVFGNVDSDGDRVIPGAYTDTLAKNPRPALVFAHQWGNPSAFIGETLGGKETPAGLVMRGRLFVGDGEDHEGAKAIYPALKAGMINNFSFSYDVVSADSVWENGKQIRELKTLDLLEWGPCMVGANRSTMLLNAPKSLLAGVMTPDQVRDVIYLPTFATASTTNDTTSSWTFTQSKSKPDPEQKKDPAAEPESPAELPASKTIEVWRYPALHHIPTGSR